MCNVIRRNAAALLPLSVPFRTPWPLPAAAADPLRCRSAPCEGSAASSREPVQLRCRGSWSEGSGEPLSECVPGLHGGRAAGDDRAETPGPLLRRRSCVGGVPGQPVPAAGLSERRSGSHAGGAGWGGGTVHSCRCPCPRGAAIAGVPTRWSSRLRLAAPVGERRAGFRGCCTRYRGSAYRVEEQQPTTTPHRVSGGVQGGAFPSPVCVGRSNEKRGRACKALPLVAFKGRPGDGRSGLGLSPAPTG